MRRVTLAIRDHIVKRLINFCWSIFKWVFALALVAALSAGGYLYFQLDEEIRRYAEGKLSGHYGQLEVSVGGARFVPGRGVAVYDVSLAEGTQQRTASGPLLHIDELLLAGRFEMQQFIDGQPVIERLIVRRPRLEATRGADGVWCFQKLLPLPPNAGGPAPPLEIVDATLVVADKTKPDFTPVVLRNTKLTIERAVDAGGNPAPGAFQFAGTAEDSVAKRVTLSGWIVPATGAFELHASVEKLRLSDELLKSLPGVEPSLLEGLGLQATVSVRSIKATSKGTGKRTEWSGSFRVDEGVVSHPALPRPVTDLNLDGSFNNRGLSVRSMTAKCGVAEITAACNRNGWGDAAPMAVRGRADDVPLDDALRDALPGSLKKQWLRFRPSGVVDATGSITFDGSRWRIDGRADCRNLSVEDAERFPYRLTSAHGPVEFTDAGAPGTGKLTIDLQGEAEGRLASITAEFHGLPCPGEPPRPPRIGPRAPCPVGWVEVNAPQLRVTPAMIAALGPHPQAQKIAKALSPTGEFGMHFRMERLHEQQLKPTIAIDLEAKGCAINYDRFPYPLDHIRGRLQGRGNVWTFDNLEAREPNGPRVVTASGSLKPVNGRPRFELTLTATAAALDEALRSALPLEQQGVWAKLRPEGRVSFVTDVTYNAGDPRPRIDVELTPHKRNVSIEPTFFQYRLHRVDGRFVVTDGRLTFTGGRAEHGRTMVAADGSWTPGADGAWQLLLQKINVDYLDANHDLRLAAPLALRRVIDELQPEGNFSVHDGQMAFTYEPHKPQPLRTDWDLHLDCHQTDVNFGVRVEGVSGGVRIAGVSESDSCRAYGELNVDSLLWNGMQLTDVRGPLWSNASECRLGRGVAEKQPGAPPVAITAKAYGGDVSFNTRVLHGKRPTYNMAIGLQNIDLERFTRDYLRSTTPLTGKANGRLTLAGAGASIHGLEGTGAISVQDANLYKLPFAVALLKVLRNRAPNTTAFDRCNSEFVIQGQHLNFNRLDLLGDAVSLHGRGEASLDKDVDLTFHTIVGREGPTIPFIRSFVGQASEQILRLRVLGTIDQPDIRREALPVVGNVLEQLRADLQPQPLSQPTEVPRAAALRRQTK